MLSHLFISQKCHSLNKATPQSMSSPLRWKGHSPSPPTHCSLPSHPAPGPRCSSLLTSPSSSKLPHQELCSQAGRQRQAGHAARREEQGERAASSPEAVSPAALTSVWELHTWGTSRVEDVTPNSKTILHKEPQIKDFSMLRAVRVITVENVEKKTNSEILNYLSQMSSNVNGNMRRQITSEWCGSQTLKTESKEELK